MITTEIKEIASLIQARKFLEAEQLCQELEKQDTTDQEKILLCDFKSKVYRETGRLELAEESLRQELEIAEKIYQPNDLTLSAILRNLAMMLDLQQKYHEAIPYAEQALEVLRNSLPSTDLRIADAIVTLAKHHYELGRFKLAQEFLAEAQGLYEAKDGRHSLGVATCLNNLGRILENQGDTDAAINLYQEAAKIRQDLLGNHPDTAFVLLNLGTALADLGNYKEAVSALSSARDIYLELGLEDSPYLEACRKNLMLCWNAVYTPC